MNWALACCSSATRCAQSADALDAGPRLIELLLQLGGLGGVLLPRLQSRLVQDKHGQEGQQEVDRQSDDQYPSLK